MYDWIIIGGGVHGTYVSNVLINGSGVPREKVVVVDPHERPMQRWWECAQCTGMEYLRSPAVHHIALSPLDLVRFSRTGTGRAAGALHPPYDRPGVGLFAAHCDETIARGGLGKVRLQATAVGLKLGPCGWAVETDRGGLEGRRVLLALGAGDKPYWPVWARPWRGDDVFHIFDGRVHALEHLAEEGTSVAVVGKGISALQTALRLVEKDRARPLLVTRGALKLRQFDSDPCWLGPKCLRGYERTRDFAKRRQMISEARNKGSVPVEIAKAWARVEKEGAGKQIIGEIGEIRRQEDGRFELMSVMGESMAIVDRIILGTGFDSARPARTWLKETIEELGLHCASCGYPIVDSHLQWSPGLFVSGPLAELELGPASRNIWGARMTGQRVYQYLRGA